MSKIYKYNNNSIITNIVKSKSEICIKFDYPSNYNDPYELFLTPDTTDVNDEHVAYLQELLLHVPQLPTTCFSKRPDVTPMWAHYAFDHSGFVIEIDEKKLEESISIGYINDVEYSDSSSLVDMNIVALGSHAFQLTLATP